MQNRYVHGTLYKISVGIDIMELGSDVEMLEILPRDSNLKLIFTAK